MPRFLPLETVRRVAIRALQSGGTHRVTRDGKAFIHHVEWNLAPRCQSPVTVQLHGRPYSDRRRYHPASLPPKARLYVVTMETKCRKCESCLKDRGAHWRLRALSEWGQAPRTWLVTLTFSPTAHTTCLARARRKVDAQGIDFDTLSPEEQWRLRHAETGREVMLYFKRLRKEVGKMRYLMVAEQHASGLPHYHILLHELPQYAIRHASIKRHWTQGFIHAKLVEDKRQAVYACKYLTKSALARVRASVNYGGHHNTALGDSFPPKGGSVIRL